MNEKSYHHGNLRIELIEKGIEIINGEGVKAFSLRRVASDCGVSHAAPYSHFKNKEELLLAITEHITERFSEALAVALKGGNSANMVLFSMGRAYVMFFVKNPQYFSFIFSRNNASINITDGGYKPYDVYRRLMEDLLTRSGFPGEMRADTIIANWAFVHGLAAIATQPGGPSPEDWERRLPRLLVSMKITLPQERPKF